MESILNIEINFFSSSFSHAERSSLRYELGINFIVNSKVHFL